MAKEPNYIVPKDSLRKLTKFEQLAKSKALDSAQHGQTPMQRELVALEFELVRDDTPGVQSYVSQMVNVIREHEGSLADLLLAVPLLKEVATVARINDFSLSQKEKSRVEQASMRMQAFIQKHTTLKARTMASLQTKVMNVARNKREAVAQSMSTSASALFRLAGRALTPKNTPTTDYEKSVKETRAEVYSNTLERRNVAMREANRGGGGDFDFGGLDDFGGSKGKKPRRMPKDDGGFGGFGLPGGGGEGVSGSTTLFQSMLTELQAIRSLLRRQVEDDTQDEEAAYRSADNTPGLSAGPRQIKDGKKKIDSPSLVGTLMNAAGTVVSAGVGAASAAVANVAAKAAGTVAAAGRRAAGAATKVVTAVVKSPLAKRALGFLGPAAAVVGAGWTGWEIGKQIDKYTGASTVLGDALASMSGVKSDSQHVQEMAAERQAEVSSAPPALAVGESGSTPGAPATLSTPPTPSVPARAQGAGPAGQTNAPQGRGARRVPRNDGEKQMLTAMDAAGINDPTERAAMLAQMSHESQGFTRMKERYNGDPVQYFEGKYGMNTRVGKKLGNTQPGDGYRFRGRGFTQLTGRWNYMHFGKKIGVDLLANPDLAATPAVAAKLAVAYWQERVRPRVKNFNDTRAVSLAINGGTNGMDDRVKQFAEYMGNTPTITPSEPSSVRTAAPVATAALASAGQGTTVIAPTTVVQSTSAPAPATVVPMPMRTENAEVTLRALRAANSI